LQGFGLQALADTGMPPARLHKAASTRLHVPAVGQQHATGWLTHPPGSGQDWFGKNCPPSWLQMFAFVCTQVFRPALLGTQQAPKKLDVPPPDGQTAGLQLVTQMPPYCVRQSHWLGAAMHPCGEQHSPIGWHGLGWHEARLGNTVPLHAEALATRPQLPAASQHTIIGHGFGLHAVEDVSVTPLMNGHGTAVEHAPVCGSQQTVTGGHGLGLHVEPGYAIVPVGQAVLAKMNVHWPVAGSQQAVTHGLGVHTPFANQTPPWQLACVTPDWHIVVPGMQQAPVTGTPLHG
jgi:hypothetical protein